IPATQEMLDFCAEHGIGAEIETSSSAGEQNVLSGDLLMQILQVPVADLRGVAVHLQVADVIGGFHLAL
ncbi:hypothetical protein ACWDNR_25960, partial [Gordonia aichiensis]